MKDGLIALYNSSSFSPSLSLIKRAHARTYAHTSYRCDPNELLEYHKALWNLVSICSQLMDKWTYTYTQPGHVGGELLTTVQYEYTKYGIWSMPATSYETDKIKDVVQLRNTKTVKRCTFLNRCVTCTIMNIWLLALQHRLLHLLELTWVFAHLSLLAFSFY